MTYTVTVIGATGNIGRALSERLLKNGVNVRAVGRGKDGLSPLVQLGAEPRIGSIDNMAFVSDALRGADAAFLMIPPHYGAPDMRADQRHLGASLIEGVKKSRIQRVVSLSSLGSELASGTGPILGLREFENAVRGVPGLISVILRPTYFMENHLGSISMIKQAGINGSAMRPDTRLPMVATRDIAGVALEYLSVPTFTTNMMRDILGPRDYTMLEATAILGAAIGRTSLPYVQFSEDDFKRGLESAGFSADVARNFYELNNAFNMGWMQKSALRTPANTTVTTLEQFAREVFAPAFQKV